MVIGINRKRQDPLERLAEELIKETKRSKGMRKNVTRLQRRVERLEELMREFKFDGVRRYDASKRS